MKDLNIQKEIEQIKRVSLTTDEKSKMLHNLSMYADLHVPVQSPFSIFSFIKQPLARKFSYAIASILIAVLVGGTAAYASENSLPGEMLYNIKTKIVEPLRVAMAKTSEEKAKIETELADTRLKEAEDLDKVGKLTPEFKKNLDERFNNHFSKYSEFKKEIEGRIASSSKDKTEEIQKEFNDKMSSHNEILNKLDRDVKGMKRIERKTATSEDSKKEVKLEIKRPSRDPERN